MILLLSTKFVLKLVLWPSFLGGNLGVAGDLQRGATIHKAYVVHFTGGRALVPVIATYVLQLILKNFAMRTT
ncbi:unnamed protein product [Lathyrus sativus]|nr:unnamed protein product [Lathyrus sativus]